jgi:hypothetical protein
MQRTYVLRNRIDGREVTLETAIGWQFLLQFYPDWDILTVDGSSFDPYNPYGTLTNSQYSAARRASRNPLR